MRKLAFFLQFYRNQKMKFLILVCIFAFAGAILSCSLLVRSNNKAYARAQAQAWVQDDHAALSPFGDDLEKELDRDLSVFTLMGRVMTVFVVASILIVAWGCTSILMFQNNAMQKSHAMLKIFGMGKRDIFIRALTEGISFGLLGSILGDLGGYFLFSHLSRKLCNIDAFVPMFSFEMLKILFLVVCILTVIAFFGSLISGLSIYEMPIVYLLYGRNGEKEKQTNRIYGVLEFAILYVLISFLFWKSRKEINVVLVICGVILLLLLGIFTLFFHEQGKKRNHGIKVLEKISGISYRFLCSRHKRDAMLAATVSVGAILICVTANFIFDFRVSLRDAFSKNEGYTTVVEVPGLMEQGRVQEILDQNGYRYTKGYTKIIKYRDIGVAHDEDKDDYDSFFALVIDGQTADIETFQVPEGCFASENYFSYRCNLELREESDIFGKELKFYKRTHQGGGMVSIFPYNFIINKSDFGWEMDDTWDTVYILNVDRESEVQLENLTAGERCMMITTTEEVNQLVRLLSDYLSIVAVIGVMIVLVTGTFFYSMVRSDLLSRSKEMFLYRVYGASRRKAFWVIFLEYLMIAWIASACVIAASMLVGGFVYGILLGTYYPLTMPVIAVTVVAVTLFVLGCCYIAQWMNFRGGKMEMIRDE
ncbi:MAG: hypothetical protein NC307_08455 [Roseburia sp.]|nr:hypothetical protein [Roseburia sp.]